MDRAWKWQMDWFHGCAWNGQQSQFRMQKFIVDGWGMIACAVWLSNHNWLSHWLVSWSINENVFFTVTLKLVTAFDSHNLYSICELFKVTFLSLFNRLFVFTLVISFMWLWLIATIFGCVAGFLLKKTKKKWCPGRVLVKWNCASFLQKKRKTRITSAKKKCFPQCKIMSKYEMKHFTLNFFLLQQPAAYFGSKMVRFILDLKMFPMYIEMFAPVWVGLQHFSRIYGSFFNVNAWASN